MVPPKSNPRKHLPNEEGMPGPRLLRCRDTPLWRPERATGQGAPTDTPKFQSCSV